MKKSYSPAFKVQIVRDLLKEEKSANQLAAEHGLHPNQLYRWREIALAGLPSLFAHDSGRSRPPRMPRTNSRSTSSMPRVESPLKLVP